MATIQLPPIPLTNIQRHCHTSWYPGRILEFLDAGLKHAGMTQWCSCWRNILRPLLTKAKLLNKMVRFLLYIGICLLIAGCAGSPFSRDSNHLTGNAAGPVLGGAAAVAGTAALGAPRPLIYGAGLGGIALGYYMTTLRFDAGPIIKAGGDVYTQGQYVGISIPSYKLFEPNSAEFSPQAESLLNSAVAVLKRYPSSNIFISGNTSGFSSLHADQKLSEARARQVASYLWAHGINNFKHQSINMRKLTFVGYGDYFPVMDKERIANVQKNSRIQITSYPSKADLKLDQNSTVFNNIGGYDENAQLSS